VLSAALDKAELAIRERMTGWDRAEGNGWRDKMLPAERL
jgi:hypothetical protein